MLVARSLSAAVLDKEEQGRAVMSHRRVLNESDNFEISQKW
jgi:hypothetical protein